MNRPASWSPQSARHRSWVALVARISVGGLFVWMGASKANDPVGFLKLVRQYDVLHTAWMLNAVAIVVPWLEIVCGVLLLTGRMIRGTALVSLGMLAVFTVLIWQRALAMQTATDLSLCMVRFDCGCGAGEVWVCRKLAENTLLLAASAYLVLVPAARWPWKACPSSATDAPSPSGSAK